MSDYWVFATIRPEGCDPHEHERPFHFFMEGCDNELDARREALEFVWERGMLVSKLEVEPACP